MMPDANNIISVIRTKYECGKIQYNSFKEAQAVINYGKNHRRYINGRRVNRRVGKKDIRPIRSYKCEICGFWHLTSQPDFNE
jgi:hypothetical protein